MSRQPLLGRTNVVNALLVMVVPLPAVALVGWLFATAGAQAATPDPGIGWHRSPDDFVAMLLHHPVLAANLLYFVFVDVVFFAIALVQRSSWLIDPYWTLLPPLLAAFYTLHPWADPDPVRLALGWTALVIWSVRLTWSYFRRECWRFGLREDWRYAKMRAERPGFWWEQFFIVHLAQHAMLVGLSLPFWAIAFRPAPLASADVVLFALALIGLAVARAADTELDRFMRENERRVARGEPRVVLLDRGIWRLSRHPNYFGEQLFWWSIAGLGVVCGEPWVVIGTAFNTAVLAGVTVMTERRMLAVEARKEAYLAYQRRTSVWLPWGPRLPRD